MSTTTHSRSAAAPAFAAFSLVSVVVAACAGPSQPADYPERAVPVAIPPPSADGPGLVTNDGGSGTTSAPATADGGVDAGGADAGSFFARDKLCGCKLCAPKVSDDACTTDADCAPSSACHATSCIAASKVQPATTRPICTRIMLCATTDANACTCYQGKCALTPRP